MKAKLPLKKGRVESDELDQRDDERTDPSHDVDKTNITELHDEEAGPKTSSLVHKLKNKIKGLNKSKAAVEEEDDAGEVEPKKASNDAAAKKKKTLQIVIVAGLVLFLISDYIIPTDEEPAPVAPPIKRQVKKNQETPVEAVSEEPTTTPVETAPETPVETPSEVSTETTPDSPVTVTSEAVPSEAPLETAPEPMPEPQPEPEPEPEVTVPTLPDPSTSTVDSIDGTDPSTNTNENLTDQILQDLEKQAKKDQVVEQKKEYVAPPDYEYRGRGLVYNCKGKHWACIDAPSYKICEDNASSVRYLNKATECHPFNVYDTPKGCESMQNRMVSSSAKTNFCND